ncbi:inositol phosphorylceramide synthase [Paenibacillus sp. N3.4]|nr:inositol phosphorylceramide synthase [Paenibacillus sp. N3.4]
MKTKLRTFARLLWILIIPVLNIFYGVLNHGGANVRSLMTALDERIPLIPAFIIPYLIWYPFVFVMLIVLFTEKRRAYYRTLITLCLGLVSCYIIFHLFQTSIHRPQITDHGWLSLLIRLVYQMDGPYNCFPSIHALTSYLILRGSNECLNLSRVSRLLIGITSWSIIISTVFVKQHVVLDILGAIVLAELLIFAVGKWFPSLVEAKPSNVLKSGRWRKYL